VRSGSLELTEHVASRWLQVSDLSTLDWAAADVPVVDALIRRHKN